MADEISNPPSAPAASPESVPVEAAPSQVEVPVSPAPVESAPAPAAEPEAEPAPVEAPAEAPAETTDASKKPETLLAGDKKPEEGSEEIKTEEKSADTEVKEEPVAEIPVFEPFTLPENIQVDDARMGEFTKALGEFESLTNAPHEEVQKLGQQLVDKHLSEMQRYTESLTQAWEKQKSDWLETFQKDPEFTNRHDTVVNAAIDAIGIYAGDAKQQAEFRDLMESSGLGNHPAMIRMLSNIMLAKAEPKPLAAPTIATPARVSKVEKMYGKKTG